MDKVSRWSVYAGGSVDEADNFATWRNEDKNRILRRRFFGRTYRRLYHVASTRAALRRLPNSGQLSDECSDFTIESEQQGSRQPAVGS
jgi:hypothetical protein